MDPRLTNVLVIGVLVINLLLAALVGYYIWVDVYNGDAGDAAVDLLDALLRHRQNLGVLVGSFIVAVPGLAMGLATKDNKITPNGWIYLGLLGATAAVSLVCVGVWDPLDVDLGSSGTPGRVSAAASYLASNSLALIASIGGFRFADKIRAGKANG